MPPERRPKWVQGILFVGGMAVMALVGWLIVQLLPGKPLPEGWLRLTPPRDVMGLAAYGGEIWAGG